jgi:hypothetical protein
MAYKHMDTCPLCRIGGLKRHLTMESEKITGIQHEVFECDVCCFHFYNQAFTQFFNK